MQYECLIMQEKHDLTVIGLKYVKKDNPSLDFTFYLILINDECMMNVVGCTASRLVSPGQISHVWDKVYLYLTYVQTGATSFYRI